MQSWSELKGSLLKECEDDEVGLWSIVWELRRYLGMKDPAQIRQASLQMVRELLETGDIVAGSHAPPGSGLPPWRVVSWPGSVDDIVARIDREWDKLGREPRAGGEIVTLQAKD